MNDELIWFRGHITSVTEGQECQVVYDDVEDEDGDELGNSWEGPILEDYHNNDVRFVR